MNMESHDPASLNRAKLRELFPNCVTEGPDQQGGTKLKVNMEMLRQMLLGETISGEEAYEFTWVGKRASVAEANRPVRKTLRPDLPRSRDWDRTKNIYIEGDNLDALKLLQLSYQGAVKLIYIDPPYNTGRDFIYPDSFLMDEEHYACGTAYFDEDGNVNFSRENSETAAKYHSDWCSMIYARLLLARNLLRDDGVILINMDEHEISNLQKICGEIFGEENDLGTIIWDKRNPKGDARGISCQHEYIVAYARNKGLLTKNCRIQRPKRHAEEILKKAGQLYAKIGEEYSLADANDDFASWMREHKGLSGGERAYNRIDENGDVYRAVSMAWPNKKRAPEDYFLPLIHPVTKRPCPVPERGWRNPSSTMKRLAAEGRILFGKDETTIPNSKYLLRENMYENIPSLLYYGGSDTELLSALDIPFDTPKVVNICKEHIKAFTANEDIVLDFFSGSATVAHAVMLANAEDGARRSFLMVQLPERVDRRSEAYRRGYREICEIGEDRIRRAGDLLLRETGAGIDSGFRIFKVDESNMTESWYTARDYTQDLLPALEAKVRSGRTDLDLLFGCVLEFGLPLSLPCVREEIGGCPVYICGDELIACFAEEIPPSAVLQIAGREPLRAVFLDSGLGGSPAKMKLKEVFRREAPECRVEFL